MAEGPAKKRKVAEESIDDLHQKFVASPGESSLWSQLVEELAKKNKKDEVFATFERLSQEFPLSGQMWTKYIEASLKFKDYEHAGKLIKRCLTRIPYVPLWQVYLRYVRETSAGKPDSWATITSAFDFTLTRCRYDVQCGAIWQEYIEFLESRPAANTWEEQHKRDELRNAYRSAVGTPIVNIEGIWRAYNAFENAVSRATARKFLDERSAAYMHARSVARELLKQSSALELSTFSTKSQSADKDKEAVTQWFKLVTYEKSNPLKADEETVRARVLYTWRKAVMYMQNYTQVWFEAAGYALSIDDSAAVETLLQDSLIVNSTSFLLSSRLASFYEEKSDIEKAESVFRGLIMSLQSLEPVDGTGVTVAYTELSKIVKRNLGIQQARQIASECRQLPYCTFHIYVVWATLEFFDKQPEVASRIYQVAYQRFREVPNFVRCYLDFLFQLGDDKTAQVVFEKAMSDFPPAQARPIFDRYLKGQAARADFKYLTTLENRYMELYPASDQIELYARRFRLLGADPVGEELHLEAPTAESNEPLPLPPSIIELLDRLPPAADYDGPVIDMSRLVEILGQHA